MQPPAAARLPIVSRFLEQLRGFVRVMRLGSARDPDHLLQVVAEHEAILDAIERRDPRGAHAALTHHLHTAEYVRGAAAGAQRTRSTVQAPSGGSG